MPSRNRIKIQVSDTFYHLYNRGVNKRRVFLDDEDYAVFLNLLKRYLSAAPTKDNKGREYANYHHDLELLAYCLMPNHYHLLVYQKTEGAMTKLMLSVSTSYVSYFNKKYKRVGPLFQDRFKASMITREDYLMHISRYIHLNPRDYKSWPFSSLPHYLEEMHADWVRPNRIKGMFKDTKEYGQFVSDYEGQKAILDEIKAELADS